jgi:hypothetical protein
VKFSIKASVIAGSLAAAVALPLAGAASASAATVPGAIHAVTHSSLHNDTTNVAVQGRTDNVWAVDNLSEQFTVVPVTGQADGASYQVTIDVTGSFRGFADPTTGLPLASSGPVKGTIEYDVIAGAPDRAGLLSDQAPDTGLGAALSQLFDGSYSIVGGGAYNFSYQNGSYVQSYDPITNPSGSVTGDVTGH